MVFTGGWGVTMGGGAGGGTTVGPKPPGSPWPLPDPLVPPASRCSQGDGRVGASYGMMMWRGADTRIERGVDGCATTSQTKCPLFGPKNISESQQPLIRV